jgi:hypothetical protein
VLKADSLKLGEFFLSRPDSGTINQLVFDGTADGELASAREFFQATDRWNTLRIAIRT